MEIPRFRGFEIVKENEIYDAPSLKGVFRGRVCYNLCLNYFLSPISKIGPILKLVPLFTFIASSITRFGNHARFPNQAILSPIWCGLVPILGSALISK
jgi:hypothetical protein